ncbi:MAG: lysine-sensitive aspartokinase 3 [Balneolaceae bacterium]|nr:lysine-sensitive aspartokinase 3 [Balneolaceae bacterium]MBO6546671.1 lysine-sensitive aspartokinase 3 [Balneolaceae bacterium]MBO6649029.1 lysine-sensitive aspartokinase 3 [Balneolaceae bacterium]
MIVSKFGGTSVGTFEAMHHSASIVAENSDRSLVVISATSGTTNDLVSLEDPYLDSTSREAILLNIENRHLAIIDQCKEKEKPESSFRILLSHLRNHLELPGRDKKWKDTLYAFGELMSTRIFAGVLKEQGIDVEWLDARDVLKTDSTFGNAVPNVTLIKKYVEEKIDPEKRYLTQGFIGRDEFGNTTTLGRGGSDYSAALFAEAVNADLLEIWTDVAGVYSTDPRIVAEAQPISEITFDEAAELSVFGGKVLHPATLKPAIRGGVKVRVASSKQPELPGTLIVNTASKEPVVRAISLRKDQTLLTVKSLEMLHQHGFLAKLFGLLAEHKISVDLVTTSEVSVSLTLDTAHKASNKVELTEDILDELRTFCEVDVEKNLSLVALIGNKMDATSGISGTLFGLLENHNIRLVCHGASPNNVCFLVKEGTGEEIVKLIHRKFIE